MKTVVGIFILIGQTSAFAMTLPDYLKTVASKHKSIQSFNISKEAAEDRREASDIQLTPVFSAGVDYLNDKSPLGQFAMLGATETVAKDLKLGLSEKFSSGTALNLNASASEINNQGNLFIPTLDRFSYGTLGVGVSQSLWKDSFGHATRLRWQREDVATTAEIGKYDLQSKALLVDAEMAYWDYLYQRESVKIGRASLERAKKIEAWTQRRVSDGISDRADLLSAQALVAARRLQLVSAEDNLSSAKRKIQDYLEMSETESIPELTGNISESRSLNSMIDGKGGKVMALEAYLSSLSAKALALAAQETEDAYKPDLSLGASYATNTLQTNQALVDATSKWGDNSRPTWKVGLNFTYLFDTDVKAAAKSVAKKEALAAKLQSERKLLDSQSTWLELNRRYGEMNKRILTAQEISQLQMAAAKAQTDLFNKGRSITANVIKAEEDAGDAELTLTRLKTEQRKMEAQGRLFVVIEEK
ncbi:MAG: TolC family protein [Pseudobdellovibrionaceae bacterium]